MMAMSLGQAGQPVPPAAHGPEAGVREPSGAGVDGGAPKAVP
jgi:hypothetical protein